ncbi:inactive transglutaminase family protein [SAR92 clade bacterium H455]|uniref:Inactive transglutaminase family protein n=1 Tax=SAR92 clade bacterium H455 TaxID=2974818 RepID=A0ABY5TQE1_9GAMM|nr:inactive transglutaminase family protein [SAR92 clade bacterium H455]
MINSRIQIGLISGLLIALGVGLTLYKAVSLNLPLVPGEYREVWTVESKTSFTPAGGPVNVGLRLPAALAGWTILDEHFVSSGFGFSIMQEPETVSTARWTRQSLDHPTTLYYKMQIYRARADRELPALEVEVPVKPLLEADQQAAMDRVVQRIQQQSSDRESFTLLLLQELLRESQDQDILFLLNSYSGDSLEMILHSLASAGIPAHELRGIELEDGRRRQTLSSLIELYSGEKWIIANPSTARLGLPDNFFIWQRGDGAILNLIGGRNSSLEFALVSNSLPAKAVLGMEQRAEEFALLDFSIYSLPVEQQGIFKGLLLIPVAALVVVVMRLLVGVQTSGTFMPILIALAFIQTTLLVGLIIFLVLIGSGLWIRSYLSRLNLLLVARVATVIIVVILLMAALAVTSYKLGLDQILTVTFFPTVIVAWTIERMSILWEEEGGHEVLIQGSGSLLVAVLAYLAMSNNLVEHLTFNFPELTLSLLGMILLLGKYTGYRLSELYRFRDLAGKE